LKNSLFVTFSYEEWPLAANLEIFSEYQELGLEPIWLDLTAGFRNWFEFPVSSFLHRRITTFKLKRLFPTRFTAKELILKYYSNSLTPERNVRAEEVALQELISQHRNSQPCLVHNKREYQNYVALYSKIFQFASNYLLENSPDHIVLFNGRFIEERAFWDAAISQGIRVKFYETFLDTWSDRYQLFDEPTHSPSYRGKLMMDFGAQLLESNPSLFYEEANKFFKSRMNGGGNKYTAAQEISTSYAMNKPIVSFFHSSQDELVMVGLIDDYWSSQEMAVLETVKILEEIGGIQFILRIHPHLLHKAKEEIGRWNTFGNMLARQYDWLTFIPADSPSNSYDLIKASNLIITCASTVGVEAAYFGKPSILLGRAFHESMGITHNPKSSSELKELILRDFAEVELEKSKLNALNYGLFLSLGGQRFVHVATTGPSHHRYEYKGVNISKIILVRVIQKCEIQMKKNKKKLKSSVLCSHDCRTNPR
jgi:hypothetical protein